jgi:7,8-dihydropterin-6-yl-methyl-4-(beta-D-ribofuranosyl)aminobenzene 5'-phosphate synthase
LGIEGFTEIVPHLYSTGQLGEGIKEQALVIETRRGLVVLTGCAHPGVERIAQKVHETLEGRIHLVTGGFHLGSAPTREIRRVIDRLRELAVEKVGPSHCSGEEARRLFRETWGADYVEAGCGAVLRIPALQ